MKQYYDLSHKVKTFQVGDLVWVHNPIVRTGYSAALEAKWRGPYKVANKLSEVNYRVEDLSNNSKRSFVVHVQRLHLYKPLSE